MNGMAFMSFSFCRLAQKSGTDAGANSKSPAQEVEALELDADGFTVKEVEQMKAIGARRIDCPSGVYYSLGKQGQHQDDPGIPGAMETRIYPTDEAAEAALLQELPQYRGALKDPPSNPKG